MAKLYFRYGTMDSAKTLNLLAVAHNYLKQGKRVVLAKPALDVRFGDASVASRAGLQGQADLLLEPDSRIALEPLRGVDCILVDEAQFLSPAVIDQLRMITLRLDLPVICYGLRTDFRGELFPGSATLLAIADSLREVRTICHCGRKATMVLRHDPSGAVTTSGEQIAVEKSLYESLCRRHWEDETGRFPAAANG